MHKCKNIFFITIQKIFSLLISSVFDHFRGFTKMIIYIDILQFKTVLLKYDPLHKTYLSQLCSIFVDTIWENTGKYLRDIKRDY